ncbi:MAG TPA: hypothetical protein VNH11_35320 [Pirellulales bacterium]|nr:hypothetical protein [Pirellulales bacterium]
MEEKPSVKVERPRKRWEPLISLKDLAMIGGAMLLLGAIAIACVFLAVNNFRE